MSDYVSDFIEPCKIRKNAAKVIAIIKRKKLKFDAIAFRGLSGAVIAPMVALKLRKTLIAIRKEKTNHSHRLVEGDLNAKTYIIVDDLISSGITVRKIVRELKRLNKEQKCLGVVLYSDTRPFRKTDADGYLDV